MTTRLLLLCHAATAATRGASFAADEPVEEREGPRVAGLAGRLSHPGTVLVSPARAARETAGLLGLAGRRDEGLADLDVGRWRGRTLAEIVAAEPEGVSAWMGDPDAAPHGGESVVRLLERVEAWLAVAAGHRAVLAITHAAVARAAVVHVLGAPAGAFWKVDVPPLGLVELSHDGRRWSLRCPVA